MLFQFRILNNYHLYCSCSIPCWNIHKESNCERTVDETTDLPVDPVPSYFPTDDTVDPAKLELLRNSSGLKDILRNPHLRSLLREVDSAENAWRAISAAMNEPLFLEFADEILKVIEPDTDSPPEEVIPME